MLRHPIHKGILAGAQHLKLQAVIHRSDSWFQLTKNETLKVREACTFFYERRQTYDIWVNTRVTWQIQIIIKYLPLQRGCRGQRQQDQRKGARLEKRSKNSVVKKEKRWKTIAVSKYTGFFIFKFVFFLGLSGLDTRRWSIYMSIHLLAWRLGTKYTQIGAWRHTREVRHTEKKPFPPLFEKGCFFFCHKKSHKTNLASTIRNSAPSTYVININRALGKFIDTNVKPLLNSLLRLGNKEQMLHQNI